MSEYDFKSINDKEFEILCSDIIGSIENVRFERFKAGKDKGIDGRYFTPDSGQVILQCKHWANTSVSQLIAQLKKHEISKIDAIKPSRYILATSLPLSPHNKQSIKAALFPHVTSEADVYGQEDLNDALRSRPEIEQSHYKLWMQSTAVLKQILNAAIYGRSTFSLEEISQSTRRYVLTKQHNEALDRLEKLRVVIITGEPGIGKTTLANQLCLHYVVNGYSYVKISDDIKEAEALFDNDSQQIFYFDDFLGSNYLASLGGHEGAVIVQFIRRIISNKNKRFVLTSRSTILNQGKILIDSLDRQNIQRNELELRINSFSDLDKGRILYSHIWHSDLEIGFVDQIYQDRRYRQIVSHKSFNPRLINYITDATRLETCPAEDYWDFITNSLNNPAKIWEHPFLAQLDDYSRTIVFLVSLAGRAIDEKALSQAYYRYLSIPENRGLSGRREFHSNIRLLTGSFLNRILKANGEASLGLFNPSIGDFIISRYKADQRMMFFGAFSLRNNVSLKTISDLKSNKFISEETYRNILVTILKEIFKENFSGLPHHYISYLCYLIIQLDELESLEGIFSAGLIEILGDEPDISESSLIFVRWGLSKKLVSVENVIRFIDQGIEQIGSDEEISEMIELVTSVETEVGAREHIMDRVREHVVTLACENFSEFFDISEAFDGVIYNDYDSAKNNVKTLIEDKLNTLGLNCDYNDVSSILDTFDIQSQLDAYTRRPDYDWPTRSSGMRGADYSGFSATADPIDDLFDRS